MGAFKAAVRSARRSRSFGLVVVATLSAAIAATTAIFSAYDQLVLHPVTIPNPSSLVAIWFNNPQRNVQTPSISIQRYDELRASVKAFDQIGLSAFDSFTLTDNGEPTQLNTLRVSSTFFATLGITPWRGRDFTAAEDVPNGPAVCLISYELWQTQFGGNDALVGRTIHLDGLPWQVVGIMPPRLSVPFGQVQVFVPRVFEVAGLTPLQIQAGATYAQPIARLKPGVSLDQARAELAAFSRGYKERHPENLDANNISEPRLFVATLVGGFAPTMYMLLAAAACVLLIACANIASLFLSRLLTRRREIAVRLSLGATRTTIVGQFLAESFLFSAAAGIAGTMLTIAALAALQGVVAPQLPPNTTLTLNWRAFVFTTAITLLCTFFTGLVPALQASRPDVVEQLKDRARATSGARGGRIRETLIVAEVALSFVLLVGAGLLLASFLSLQRTSAGFEPGGVAAAFVAPPASRSTTPQQQIQFFDEILGNLRAQPGVTAAAVAFTLPLGGSARTTYGIAGQPLPPPSQRPILGMNVVSAEYFRLFQIAIAQGRAFDADDRAGAPGVCIVNETFARRLFPGESVIGRAILLGAGVKSTEIVGVIRDVKSAGVNAPTPDEVYLPVTQLPRLRPGVSVVAKTSGDPSALQSVIRSAVAAVDRTQAISFFATMDSIVALSLGTQRLVATLTVIFAGLALVLSLTGLYSVLAYLVSQRTAEIGIRMALGASRQHVIGLVMKSGLGLVGLGLVLGLAIAAVASRFIQQLLFGVAPLSVTIYAAVGVLFASIAALACLVPSVRASRIDPLIAFHTE